MLFDPLDVLELLDELEELEELELLDELEELEELELLDELELLEELELELLLDELLEGAPVTGRMPLKSHSPGGQ